MGTGIRVSREIKTADRMTLLTSAPGAGVATAGGGGTSDCGSGRGGAHDALR